MKVRSLTYGEGSANIRNNIIEVQFADGSIKKFPYPDAIAKGFLILHDKKTVVVAKEKYEEKLLKEQEEFEEKHNFDPIKQNVPYRHAIDDHNFAFKFNYCDGGKDENHFGFKSYCSCDQMKYNITTGSLTNFCNNSKCKAYIDGCATIEDVETDFNNGLLCYESCLLNNWIAKAGVNHAKGKARTMEANIGKLVVLTTCVPETPESERVIFGAFIIDKAFQGNDMNEGCVQCTTQNRIELTKEEAEQVKFWSYFTSKSGRKVWPRPLYRKISDTISANILKAIAMVKQGKPDEKLAKDLYEKYCSLNGVPKTL